MNDMNICKSLSNHWPGFNGRSGSAVIDPEPCTSQPTATVYTIVSFTSKSVCDVKTRTTPCFGDQAEKPRLVLNVDLRQSNSSSHTKVQSDMDEDVWDTHGDDDRVGKQGWFKNLWTPNNTIVRTNTVTMSLSFIDTFYPPCLATRRSLLMKLMSGMERMACRNTAELGSQVAARVWNGKLGVRWVEGRVDLFDCAVTQDEELVVGLEQVVAEST